MKKYARYGDVLNVVLHHLKDGRRRDAAEVINAIPDEEVRDFAFFLALHVERDLDVLKDEVKYRVEQQESLTRQSMN